MTNQENRYTGINIQWPISELIINGKKTIETRTYPIPKNYLGKEMLLIETPGKNREFKSRIRAKIIFTRCFEYLNEKSFYKDQKLHCVTPGSGWAWNDDKGKWGWELRIIEVFDTPIPMPKKTGIKYSKDISI